MQAEIDEEWAFAAALEMVQRHENEVEAAAEAIRCMSEREAAGDKICAKAFERIIANINKVQALLVAVAATERVTRAAALRRLPDIASKQFPRVTPH